MTWIHNPIISCDKLCELETTVHFQANHLLSFCNSLFLENVFVLEDCAVIAVLPELAPLYHIPFHFWETARHFDAIF